MTMARQLAGPMLHFMGIQYLSIDRWRDNILINIRINIIMGQEACNQLLVAIQLRKGSSFQVLGPS